MAMTSLQMDSMAEPGAPIDTLARYFQSHGWNFEREGDEEIVTTVKGSWSDYECARCGARMIRCCSSSA